MWGLGDPAPLAEKAAPQSRERRPRMGRLSNGETFDDADVIGSHSRSRARNHGIARPPAESLSATAPLNVVRLSPLFGLCGATIARTLRVP